MLVEIYISRHTQDKKKYQIKASARVTLPASLVLLIEAIV